MDELSILRARVAILERQMKETNVQLREFIESFEELRFLSRPLSPLPEDLDFGNVEVGGRLYASGPAPAEEEEEDEVEESTPMAD